MHLFLRTLFKRNFNFILPFELLSFSKRGFRVSDIFWPQIHDNDLQKKFKKVTIKFCVERKKFSGMTWGWYKNLLLLKVMF